MSSTPDHSSRAHHTLGPSTLNYVDPRIGGCLGFRNRGGTSEAAEEGTANHEITEQAITKFIKAGGKGDLASFFPEEVDDETRGWFDFVAKSIQPYLEDAEMVFNETRISITDDNGKPVTFGTTDLGVLRGLGDGKKSLAVIDFKYGYHAVPHPEHNRQGWAYACGLLEKLADKGVVPDYVEIGFVQPKRESARIHSWKTDEFWPMADKEIRTVIETAVKTRLSMKEADLNPGAACDYCGMIGKCPAYAALNKLAAVKSMQLPEVLELNVDAIDTPEKAAAAMAWVTFIEAGSKAIKDRCREIAERNDNRITAVSPDGTVFEYELKRRNPSRVVTDVSGLRAALRDMGVDEAIIDANSRVALSGVENAAATLLAPQLGGTKKAAKERISSTLEARGLVEREGDSTPYLKRKQIQKQLKG